MKVFMGFLLLVGCQLAFAGDANPIINLVDGSQIVSLLVNDAISSKGLSCQPPNGSTGPNGDAASFDVVYICTYNFAPKKQAKLEFIGSVEDSQVHLVEYVLTDK